MKHESAMHKSLIAARTVSKGVIAACAIAAVTALAPASTTTARHVGQSEVRPAGQNRTAETTAETAVQVASVRAADRPSRQRSNASASARLSGVEEDLARAVYFGHVTAEQAQRFRNEIAGYIG
ncbi:hypothetical protein LWF01_04190 [Saxibacter everestensis]|uniref:SHOCT domain-containing protein n=1 Tax=Saxibacter everestensis TaxID=2909229 RepID=A0ABY8QXS0_9MICO|nr:hypothetical protein LWF01_04190 [Brevibacteriaceae bacterium ZFBP1038]